MRHLKTAMTVAVGFGALAAAEHAAAQDYYLGQMIEVGANFCPRGWVETNGQILSIAQNTALFALLGTTYGGNGQTTFALPDLRGRMILNQGQGPGLSPYALGQQAGSETVTLTINQLASHTHVAVFQTVNANAATNIPFRNSFAVTSDFQYSNVIQFDGALNAATLTVQKTGGTDPVANMSPFLVNRYCIATVGVFPSRN
jgi:microcystin-dependent protein